jgi:hypothetical protein
MDSGQDAGMVFVADMRLISTCVQLIALFQIRQPLTATFF